MVTTATTVTDLVTVITVSPVTRSQGNVFAYLDTVENIVMRRVSTVTMATDVGPGVSVVAPSHAIT